MDEELVSIMEADWAWTDGGYFAAMLAIAKNVFLQLRPYWSLALFAVLFLFAGYVVTEYLVNRRMDKEELIPILKDEMYE